MDRFLLHFLVGGLFFAIIGAIVCVIAFPYVPVLGAVVAGVFGGLGVWGMVFFFVLIVSDW